MKVAVLDLGMGNLMSIRRGLERAGAEVVLVKGDEGQEPGTCGACSTSVCKDADAVVLPGVGAFRDGMKALSRFNATISEIKEGKRVVLGICLGMQFLFSRSMEGGEHAGLDFIKGSVVRLPGNLKVPHMGWNSVSALGNSRLFNGIRDGEHFYFVHSYYCVPDDRSVVKAEADYGIKIPSIVEKGNIFGTQFHPEKSSSSGLSILANFLEAAKR